MGNVEGLLTGWMRRMGRMGPIGRMGAMSDSKQRARRLNGTDSFQSFYIGEDDRFVMTDSFPRCWRVFDASFHKLSAQSSIPSAARWIKPM
jgi:hypothetical protein